MICGRRNNRGDLVQEAICGDLESYRLLVERYRGAVLLIAEETLHSRAEAEDVAQEVFLVVFQSLTRLKEPEKFASWLYAITRFRARKAFRKERRTVAMPSNQMAVLIGYLTPSEWEHPEQSYLRTEQSEQLSRAVEALKPEWRIALLLRYKEEWSIQQIADFLAIPITTVNWRLHQARKFLRQQFIAEERSLEL